MSNDMMNTLKGLLGDNAEEKIQSVLQSLQTTDSPSNTEMMETTQPEPEQKVVKAPNKNILNTDSMEYILRLKGIIDEMGNANDDRSNLLLSLRPYMRQERQKGIDHAIRFLNLSKFSGLFRL